jgi:nucleotidyltransferase substrate binding protein (TIGR01987 family)
MLDFSNLELLIAELDELIYEINKPEVQKLSNRLQDCLKAGVLQRFEVLYEQSRKMMRKYIDTYFDNTPELQQKLNKKDKFFVIAHEYGLIDDIEAWIQYNELRNDTSHEYSLSSVNDIYDNVKSFIIDAKKLLDTLKKSQEQEQL